MTGSGELGGSERLVTDAVGRLMDVWGFKRHMGRIWALLYLSPEALTARDIQSRLGLSAGSVSTTLGELARWGVVHRFQAPQSRAERFEAEVNLWKMVSRVFRERELTEIVGAIEAFESALAEVDRQSSRTLHDEHRLRTQRERITELLEVARLGRALLEALLQTGRVDASSLARLLLGQPTKDR